MRYLSLSLFFIFTGMMPPGTVYAAAGGNDPNLTLEIRAIPSKVTLGEEIRVVIQLERPKGYSIEPISKDIKLAPFEVRSTRKFPVSPRGNRVFETMEIRLAIYDLGQFKIPPIPLAVWNSSGARAQAVTPPIPVEVVSVGKNKTDKNDIRPIKGPAFFNLLYLWTWSASVLTAFLTALLVWRLIKRKKTAVDPEAHLPAHERVARELQRLKDEHYMAAGKAKEHYTGISDIFRKYLERRFGWEVFDLTSPEILTIFKEKNLERSIREAASEILNECDLVKFAKFIPERSASEELEKKLEQFVRNTQPPEEGKAKKNP